MFSYLTEWWLKASEKSIVSIQNLYTSKFVFVSPTVLDGCTDATLSRDVCFLSLSLSLRLWQRWWWWWWWALSWPWTCPGPVEDWAKPGRSRSYSLSCGVSEDAERLMGLRSTIGWEKSGEAWGESRAEGRLWFLPKPLVLDHQNIHHTQMTQPMDCNVLS